MRERTILMETSDLDIKISKDRVRKSVKNRLSFLTWAYKREASEFITNKVKRLAEYKEARCVMLYASTENEPDTEALIEDCLKSGKRVALPRCMDDGLMEMVEITTLSDLQAGKYGIKEPMAGLPVLEPGEFDFCIVPCLAAGPAEEGGFKRLGHGAGYYDRFLPKISCPTCVLCFKELVRDVPVEDSDVLIDIMITE